MIVRLILFSLLLLGGDGGRDGNALYRAGRFDEAARSYEDALQRLGEGQSSRRFGLLYNLGMARYRLEDYVASREALLRAVAEAPDGRERARAAYNAGNAAYKAQDLEAALGLYRQALLADASLEDARFNYEFVKRKMASKSPDDNQGGQDRIEPSAFARALKERAEALVARRQYREAQQLMQDGLLQDSTVRAFDTFTRRAGEVADIIEGTP